MTGFDPTAPEYRYFVTDLLSNSLLAEIPFQGVSYERSLKSAGKFSGNIAVIDATDALNLYENTMPGKTALYVVRDDECVWGGIIWSRSYSLTERSLSVQAAEFTSYLHHRNIWRTFSHDFGATAQKSTVGGLTVVTLSSGSYHFTAGAPVKLEFYDVSNFTYNGYYTILASGLTDTSFAVSIPTLPVGTYASTTVKVRVDTYDYTRELLTEMQVDFSDIQFPNSEIQPGVRNEFAVSTRALTNNVATLTTSSAHDLSVGQTVDVENIKAYRTNLINNPSFETNTTGWATTNVNLARVTTDFYVGSASLQITSASATDTFARARLFTRLTAIAGSPYTASVYLKNTAGNNRQHRISLWWRDSGGTLISATDSTGTTLNVGGAWQLFTVSGTAPAGTVSVDFVILMQYSDASLSNVTLADACIVEQSSTIGDYFDGNTSGLSAWTGTANNSTSTMFVDLNGSYEVSATTSTTVSYAFEEVDIASAPTSTIIATVTKKELDSTTGLVTLTTSSSHGFSVGQYVEIENVDDPAAAYATFDGRHLINSVPSSTTFTYYVYVASSEVYEATITSITHPKIESTAHAFGLFWYFCDSIVPFKVGDTVTVTGVDPVAYNITGAVYSVDSETKKIFTILNAGTPAAYVSGGEVSGHITITADNSFSVGDKVSIAGVTPSSYNSSEETVTIATSTYFTIASANVDEYETGGSVNLIVPLTGTATVTPRLFSNTYGPFPGSSDVGIDFSTNDYSGVTIDNHTYRGYELRSIGEELDEYSDTVDGFEYRIDCAYDPTTSTFTRTFVLLPINVPNPPAPGEVSPLSRFGADELVFEYPGNINTVTMDESAENAATRFFVVGNIGDLGGEASQPYAVASATDLLNGGWPLLDESQTRQDAYAESQLYSYAQRYLSEFRPPVTDLKIGVNGSIAPVIGTYAPGDWCAVIIYDNFIQMRMSSDLEIRDDILVRKIENIKVKVPDGVAFPEEVELLLFAEWEVDKIGE